MNTLIIKNSIVKFFLETFVINKRKRSILKAKWTKFILKKYTNKALEKLEIFKQLEEKDSKIIWQYWHQGEENAPEIIKKCLNSIKKNYQDYQINVLSFDTIKNYIDIPRVYYNLLENKKIPIAIFSDILRLNLLAKYGGIWIDATMYASDRLQDDILNSDFFVFQKNPELDPMTNCMSCYFIKSKANNILLNSIKLAIEEYWQENDYLLNYFMFEHIVTILHTSCKDLKQEWQKIPYYYAGSTCRIQSKKFETYDKEYFEKILEEVKIHKLTYKNFPEKIKENTFISKLFEL